MVFTLIIMVIILLVLIPVGIVVDKKIEAYLKIKENLKFKLVELRKSEVGGYTHENCNH